jgi:hypothetical protein
MVEGLPPSDPAKYRVYWFPQVPCKPFHVPVYTLQEAKKILTTLAEYDKFQLENNIKPDYCNTGGLEVFEDGEWVEWSDEEGNNIDAFEWVAKVKKKEKSSGKDKRRTG